jgi:hypothetical protein
MWFIPHLSGIISPSSMIMHYHSVRIVSEYLDEIGIASMQWPARSQDLNPIENLWDMMGQRVRALQPPPAKLVEHGEQIIAIWDNQDQANALSTINFWEQCTYLHMY